MFIFKKGMKARVKHAEKKEKEILLDESAEIISAGSGRLNGWRENYFEALK